MNLHDGRRWAFVLDRLLTPKEVAGLKRINAANLDDPAAVDEIAAYLRPFGARLVPTEGGDEHLVAADSKDAGLQAVDKRQSLQEGRYGPSDIYRLHVTDLQDHRADRPSCTLLGAISTGQRLFRWICREMSICS